MATFLEYLEIFFWSAMFVAPIYWLAWRFRRIELRMQQLEIHMASIKHALYDDEGPDDDDPEDVDDAEPSNVVAIGKLAA